jgi:hypothetical protein
MNGKSQLPVASRTLNFERKILNYIFGRKEEKKRECGNA